VQKPCKNRIPPCVSQLSKRENSLADWWTEEARFSNKTQLPHQRTVGFSKKRRRIDGRIKKSQEKGIGYAVGRGEKRMMARRKNCMDIYPTSSGATSRSIGESHRQGTAPARSFVKKQKTRKSEEKGLYSLTEGYPKMGKTDKTESDSGVTMNARHRSLQMSENSRIDSRGYVTQDTSVKKRGLGGIKSSWSTGMIKEGGTGKP